MNGHLSRPLNISAKRQFQANCVLAVVIITRFALKKGKSRALI